MHSSHETPQNDGMSTLASVSIRAAACVVACVFLTAAVSKAIAPMRFAAVVADVLPDTLSFEPFIRGVVAALVFLEAWLGAAFLVRADSIRTRRFAAAVLLLFCVLLVWMWFNPPTQGCGCISFWGTPDHPRGEAILGLVRNTGLLACIAAMHWFVGDEAEKMDHCRVGAEHRTPRVRAFTIIETLCVIVVIGVVVALVLPGLAGARRAARRSAELAEARQTFVALAAYGSDYRDAFPYLALPGAPDAGLNVGGVEVRGQFAYFTGQSRLYVNVLEGVYMEGGRSILGRTPEESTGYPAGPLATQVWLSYTAFSRPEYWNNEQTPENNALFDAGRWGDIVFPDAKGLLLDIRAHQRQAGRIDPDKPTFTWGIIQGDGSGRIQEIELRERLYRTVERPRAMFDWPVLATEGGLAGRDFVPRP